MGVTHDAVAAVRQLRVLPLGDEGVGFRDQDLASIRRSLHERCQLGIVDSLGLTERDDGAISRHGVSPV
jgi:hypothetical protein